MRQAIVALLILMSIVSALMLSGCQSKFSHNSGCIINRAGKQLTTSVGVKRYFVFDIDRGEFDNIELRWITM